MTAFERAYQIIRQVNLCSGATAQSIIACGISEAIQAEREACAEIAENHADGWLPKSDPVTVCCDIAAAIRAREGK